MPTSGRGQPQSCLCGRSNLDCSHLNKGRLEIARSVARDLGVDVSIGEVAIREFLAGKAPPVLYPFASGVDGMQLTASNPQVVAFTLQVAQSQSNVKAIAQWLCAHSQPAQDESSQA